MERRSRKRSSSAGSEKIETVGDRQGKMERYCSTGQNPQQAVAPTEEEEEEAYTVKPYDILKEKNELVNLCTTSWSILFCNPLT